MAQFAKERFRDICQAKRAGDFGILGNGFHMFFPETLASWVAQGAPAALATPSAAVGNEIPDDIAHDFQFDQSRLLSEVHNGLHGDS